MSGRALFGAATLAALVAACGGTVGGSGQGGTGGGSAGAGGSTGTGTSTSSAGSGGSTDTSTGGVVKGSCAGPEPALPPADCTPAAPECNAATNACVALHEAGAASSFHFRIAQLDMSAPAVFATSPILK